MTAVVGILNKQAIAIAADSAVTISDGQSRKIFNKANKIFTLSKCHPVGIMIYNNAAFMSTPWEVLIKIYRHQLADISFDTLLEYQLDFIKFLKSNNYYSDKKTSNQYFIGFVSTIISKLMEDMKETLPDDENINVEKDFDQFCKYFLIVVEHYISAFSNKNDFCEEFLDYSLEQFVAETHDIIQKLFSDFFDKEKPSDDLLNKLNTLVFLMLKSKETITDYTGLIFVGFGEKEIYPNLIPLNISFVFNDRLRCFVDSVNAGSISNQNPSAICPFAQIDVMDTILKGVAPDIDRLYLEVFNTTFSEFKKIIIDRIGDEHQLLKQQIESIDLNHLPNNAVDLVNQYKSAKFIRPLLSGVESLSKEDLGEMAESLIYLTYLKRRMTNAEESVGGPVDVAIISKGDGFVWIKRKQYFRAELNNNFFHNYNKF